ncbi:hypothetical protein MUU72_14740 [Streptomyces sp. RS10V-4]|uniref:hypothetical protein n=1 Tax=Streptomyces rhizoryzae TaxID=2932493 RepID=UPI0020065931|nr:hypothetical protein [Streptomyces rhizoryzae]MCK7624343.1 hypothetical protein [Streptomyces rhizoryzae]
MNEQAGNGHGTPGSARRAPGNPAPAAAPRTPSAAPAAASKLLHPVGAVTTTVRRIPGAGRVSGAFDEVLDTVGLVSPRARRIAAYTGAGLLGAFGAVDWPVAAAGAAAVWLTQRRPDRTARTGPAPETPPGAQAPGPAAADRPPQDGTAPPAPSGGGRTD